MKKFILTPLCFALIFFSCNVQKLGHNASSGAVEGVTDNQQQLDSTIAQLSRTLAKNLREQLYGDSARDDIKQTVAELSVVLKDSLNSMLTDLQKKQLDALLARINNEADSLRDELIGKATSDALNHIIISALDNANIRISVLRDNLLGATTQGKIDTLLANAFAVIDTNFKMHVQPNIDTVLARTRGSVQASGQKISFFSKKIIQYLVFGIIAVALIITLLRIWFLKKKKDDLLKVITAQIDSIKDQRVYDLLVKNISEETRSKNLNTYLQPILKETKMQDEQKWKDKDQQLLHLLTSQLNKSSKQTGLLNQVEQEAEAVGLKSHLESKLAEV